MALTLEEYKRVCAEGANRYIVYCENDTGIVFFVRNKAELHESCFTNNVFEALQLSHDEAKMMRDCMEMLYADYGVEFNLLMVHYVFMWGHDVS